MQLEFLRESTREERAAPRENCGAHTGQGALLVRVINPKLSFIGHQGENSEVK